MGHAYIFKEVFGFASHFEDSSRVFRITELCLYFFKILFALHTKTYV